MSGCGCEPPVSLRVSDEGEYGEVRDSGSNSVDGSPVVRLRCKECGGKAGFLAVGGTTFDDEVEETAEPGGIYPHVQFDVSISDGSEENPDIGVVQEHLYESLNSLMAARDHGLVDETAQEAVNDALDSAIDAVVRQAVLEGDWP